MLDREEYVEQAYLYELLIERMKDSIPMQDLLDYSRMELLSTTKLPLAVSFMLDELRHFGTMSSAMKRLSHYFHPFQIYLVSEAEREAGRFDMKVAVQVLYHEAKYRSENATPQGMFFYQFETLCRNRLDYDRGAAAIADDPIFDETWKKWILWMRNEIGLIDLSDLVYMRSETYALQLSERGLAQKRKEPPLFGEKEGKIAWANRGRDPMYLFSALQRHLGYPFPPRLEKRDSKEDLLPQMMRRLERMEMRMKLLEQENRQGIDITKFYQQDQPAVPLE